MTKNYCDYKGAKEIAETINSYWSQEGYNVEAKVVPHSASGAAIGAITTYDVRSNLVNGLPINYVFKN